MDMTREDVGLFSLFEFSRFVSENKLTLSVFVVCPTKIDKTN